MRWRTLLIASVGLAYAALLHATTFQITPDTKMVGDTFTTQVQSDETFSEIARHYDVGYYALVDANPHLDPWQPEEGATVLIPRKFILPPGPHSGIVVNLAELRLYYYSPDGRSVTTFPIGIGSELWPTPITTGKVVEKKKHPAWYVPPSIQKEHAERGDTLPAVVPAGPENPLGDYALKLSIPGYLIHGTNSPAGIGRRITHGCMRMYPEDIEHLFNQVSVGTGVRIIHAPLKQAWVDGTLYVEMHPPLAEYPHDKVDLMGELMNHMYGKGESKANFNVDWDRVKELSRNPNGIPTPIGGLHAGKMNDEDFKRDDSRRNYSNHDNYNNDNDNDDNYRDNDN